MKLTTNSKIKLGDDFGKNVERAYKSCKLDRHQLKTQPDLSTIFQKLDTFVKLIRHPEAPEIVRELLRKKETEYQSFLSLKDKNSDLKDCKVYLLFRDKWERNTRQSISAEVSNLNGVSFIAMFPTKLLFHSNINILRSSLFIPTLNNRLFYSE
jgi:hypothetical protein